MLLMCLQSSDSHPQVLLKHWTRRRGLLCGRGQMGRGQKQEQEHRLLRGPFAITLLFQDIQLLVTCTLNWARDPLGLGNQHVTLPNAPLYVFPGSWIMSHIRQGALLSWVLFPGEQEREASLSVVICEMPNVTFVPHLFKRQAPLSGPGLH